MNKSTASPNVKSGNRLEVARKAFGNRVILSEPFPGKPPLWIEPLDKVLSTDLNAFIVWMNEYRQAIEDALMSFGGVLWRGFAVHGPEDFAASMSNWKTFAQGYTGGTSDRKVIKGNVMESTRTAPEYRILLHQEMSYFENNPRLIAFYCHVPSPVGGHTVICDMRGFFEALPLKLQENFITKGVRYGRNLRNADVDDFRADPKYAHGNWAHWFDTRDHKLIESRLTDRGITYNWEDDGSLSFWTQRPATINHPVTGERLFFNQLYSQQQRAECIGKDNADSLDAVYGTHTKRPFATSFGDGEKLNEDDFYAMHAEAQRRRVDFDWQHGDVMLIENKFTGHGRDPYEGPRDVQVMLLD